MVRIATPKPTSDYVFAYTGREPDAETELRFEPPARHYDLTVGRFLSEEPAGYAGDGDLHRYAGNEPNR